MWPLCVCVCVLQESDNRPGRRSHYLCTGTVSPVISLRGPRSTHPGEICAGVCVCACVCLCQRSLERLTPFTAPTTLCPSSVYHKILLMKIHAAEIKPKRISCAQLLFVAGKYVHICTCRASAGWRIRQQYTVHMYSEPGVYFLHRFFLPLYLNIERIIGRGLL